MLRSRELLTIFASTFIVILLFLFVLPIVEAAESDWVLCSAAKQKDGSGLIFFYNKRMEYPSKDIVRVWSKTTQEPLSPQEGIELMKRALENDLPYDAIYKEKSKFLFEIDCRNRKYQSLEGISYNEDGTIKTFSEEPGLRVFLKKWQYIPPDTNIDGLYKSVCR